MKQRQGLIWMTSGLLLALIAGLLTFRTINDVARSTVQSSAPQTATRQVLVATQHINSGQLIGESMVTLREVPTDLVPEGHASNLEQVVNKMATTEIAQDEILSLKRLVDPADPDAPLLYAMDVDQVLISIPADALLSRVNMLSVGNRIDIAYTMELETASQAKTVTFLSLQNLEIKGLARFSPPDEEALRLKPDAILLAVSPQDALIIKHMLDTGAPMSLFLRAPGNHALAPVTPVDSQYMIERFQLDPGTPSDVALRQND